MEINIPVGDISPLGLALVPGIEKLARETC